MKLHILFIIIVLPLFSFGQSPMTWTDVISVNPQDSLGILRPQIVLTSSNTPLVMWGKANQNIYVSRLNNGSFSPAKQVNPLGVFAYIQSWVSPTMAATGDTVYIAFKSQPDKSGIIYIVKSEDGGITFGDTIRVSNDNWSRFPSISVKNNKVVVSYMQFDANWIDPRYVVCVSNDGGTTFSNPVDGTALAPGEVCDCCPSSVIAMADKEILLFRNNDHDLRDFWGSVSIDGGNSFTLASDLDNNNWMINSCPATGPHGIVDGDHLYAVWMSGASSFARVNIVKANLNDLSLDFISEIDTGALSYQNYPKISGNNGNLGMVWQESNDGMDIKFAWTSSGVEGLVNGNRDTVNTYTAGQQVNPDMAYASGVFHIVWQDDENLSIEYRSVYVGVPSSVEESDLTNSWNIYPNPSNGLFRIEHNVKSKGMKYSVFNAEMKIVVNGNLDRNLLDLSHLSPGIYFIRLNGLEKDSYRKLVLTE